LGSLGKNSSFVVQSRIHDYRIQFGHFLPSDELKNAFVDENVHKIYFTNLPEPLKIIQSSEDRKTIHSVLEFIDALVDSGINKGDGITVIGGGVIQDIATMAASLYKRGVPWCFVPTTLQAMIDSCLGGKSSINFGGNKNVLGNFYPPNEILIDVRFLETLANVDLICGLLEGAKICAASGPEVLTDFLSIARKLSIPYDPSQSELWEGLIHLSLLEKKKFIEIDEFDTGLRKLLNFGHTFGHAVEMATNFRIPHGIAVGFGIMMSSEFAHGSSSSNGDALNAYIEGIVKPVVAEYLPSLLRIDINDFIAALAQDKKTDKQHYSFIVQTPEGLKILKEEISVSTTNRIDRALGSTINRWRGL
jgi:3-dehydroquinate synthase